MKVTLIFFTMFLSLNAHAILCVGENSLPPTVENLRDVAQRRLEMSQISPETFASQDVYTKIQRCYSKDFDGYVVEQQYIENGEVKYAHFKVSVDTPKVTVSPLIKSKF